MTAGTYHLGIDLGTTYVAAGILRDGRPEIITLGDRAPVVPSVLFFKEDGEVLSGESATRRGLGDPSRVVREFKRRVGDATPVIVGQTPYSADVLLAKLLRFAYRSVVERQGGSPHSIAITHPANWGAYKIDVLHQAVRMADVGPVTTITEPVAAAIHYASTERLDPGQTVAVYDLGGGTFDAAVLRKLDGRAGATPSSADAAVFEVLGDVEGIERLGGIDFDEAVFQHAIRWCESALGELDPDDPSVMQALARLRQECVEAKEALSTDTDVSIPVVLPNLQTEVRLTRAEFEAMIRPLLQQTVEALQRAVRSSGVDPSRLTAVLLVGGSSRTPLIAEMVGAELGRPIAVDQHPKHTVALGAAIASGRAAGHATPEPVAPVETPATERAVTERSAGPADGADQGAMAPSGAAGTPSAMVSQVIPLSRSSRSAPKAASSAAARAVAPSTPAPVAEPVAPTPVAEPGSPGRPGRSDGAHRAAPIDGRPGPGGPVGRLGTDRPLPPAQSGTGPVQGFDHRELLSGPGRAPAERQGSKVALLSVLAIALLAVVAGAAWAVTRDGSTTAAGDETVGAPDPVAVDGAEDDLDDGSTAGADVTTTETSPDPTVESTTSTSTTTSASTTTPTTDSTLAADAPLEATIAGIAIDGGRYAVTYGTSFEPLVSGDPASHHLHFFFDTVAVEDAGQPGAGPWILYDGPSPFRGYGPGDRPAAATRMCVTVATHDHAVDDIGIFHCAPLPDASG